MTKSQAERPIQQKSEDVLDRANFITGVMNGLIDPTTGAATGAIVGLTGAWGSGKSSVLNLLDAQIRATYPSAYVVRFDPWQVSGAGDLISQFFAEMIATIAQHRDHQATAAKELVKLLAKYAKIVVPAIAVTNPVVAIFSHVGATAAQALFSRKESLTEIRRKLKKRLEALRVPIVVLVDELDRIEDDEVRAIAQLVRAVADFPGVSYLLAYDAERVIQALASGDDESRGRSYLEKIVQLPISLPLLMEEETQRILVRELSESGATLPTSFDQAPRFVEIISLLTSNSLLRTPRDTKRLVSSFKIMRAVVGEEVDWIDLLGFSLVASKFPKTLERIRATPERCVVNPISTAEHIRRMSTRESGTDQLDAIIDKSEDSEGLRRLLGTLFPDLARANSRSTEHSDALSVRRCLYSVLRLGLIPNAVTRADIARLLSSSDRDVEAALREVAARDALEPLLDRLDDVYFETGADHCGFWSGVASFLKRPAKIDVNSIPGTRSIVDAFGNVLSRAVVRNKNLIAAATEVTHFLHTEGDLTLVPSWLRDHQYGYGILGIERRGVDGLWLSEEATVDLTNASFTRWRAALLSGRLLRSVWDLHSVYSMMNAKAWDDNCRQAVTDALLDDELFDALIVMLYGGNNYTGKSSIASMCDAEVFWRRVEERKNTSPLRVSKAVVDALQQSTSRHYD
jgi:ABC-type lipoprotein export system ATPase subunit